jgi:hypothetical protein
VRRWSWGLRGRVGWMGNTLIRGRRHKARCQCEGGKVMRCVAGLVACDGMARERLLCSVEMTMSPAIDPVRLSSLRATTVD